jgi:hypothetical protein
MSFSADRAGLLACARLDTAISMIESPPMPVGEDPDPGWLPQPPTSAVRVQALEEFARSSVFARVEIMRARQRELARKRRSTPAQSGPSESSSSEPEPIHVPPEAWSLSRVDARLTARLQLI